MENFTFTSSVSIAFRLKERFGSPEDFYEKGLDFLRSQSPFGLKNGLDGEIKVAGTIAKATPSQSPFGLKNGLDPRSWCGTLKGE